MSKILYFCRPLQKSFGQLSKGANKGYNLITNNTLKNYGNKNQITKKR